MHHAARLLTVAIPTWNRDGSLRRLLTELTEQVNRDRLERVVELLVCDNGSTDSTPAVCCEFRDRIRIVRHPLNIGFDANVWSCYRHAQSDYVLFFADDDIPDRNLLQIVSNLLEEHKPAVMLYSFIQPPYSGTFPSIDIPSEVELVRDTLNGLQYLIKYPKLSTYCVRKARCGDTEDPEVLSRLGTNYFFLSLAASAFLREPTRGCLLHRAPLAECSPDFARAYRFAPGVFANRLKALDFGRFREVAPSEFIASLKTDALAQALSQLKGHYLGGLIFDKEALAEGERFVWHQPWRILTARRAILMLEYLVAKHIRNVGLRNRIMSILDRCRRTLTRSRRLLFRASHLRPNRV